MSDSNERLGRRVTKVAASIMRIGERDGWTCSYCEIPLVPLGREDEICGPIRPTVINYDHCGCGLHEWGGPCVTPGGYVLPPGYEWPVRDHVIPRSRGGSDNAENLVLSCNGCNSSKGARTPEEWRAWQKRRAAA